MMLEKLQRRERLAVILGAVSVGVFLLAQFAVFPLLDRRPQISGGIEEKELTLQRDKRLVRESAREQYQLVAARGRLKSLESGLLESPSVSLANAEWQRLVREMADSQGIELGSSEFIRTQDLGSGYSLVLGRVQLRCRIDQLVQFLIALADSPKLWSVTQMRILNVQGDAQKSLSVELTLGAPLPTAKVHEGGEKP
jgi:type II secretion system (T2SS) protein M